MALIGVDIGTTHCKVGLFQEDGKMINITVRPTLTHYDKLGYPSYKPEEIWGNIKAGILESLAGFEGNVSVIGITSMAETGVVVDRETGKARTDFIPWFSRCAEAEAEEVASEDSSFQRFQKTGLHMSYKYGLAKLLHLKKQHSEILRNAVWLSASDYIAYRLTGRFATDYSLAARTYAFMINHKSWDQSWIRHFGLPEDLFPEALPSGTVMGETTEEMHAELGIATGIPVSISGHDHLVAALAVGAIDPGTIFNSIGTAETLVGDLGRTELTKRDYQAGLSFGCHILREKFFWMGGISASGGSVEWFRSQFADEQMSYEQILSLSEAAAKGPTKILYYPYLSGSGAPNPDPMAKGAFIGIKASHKREDLLKALMEGTAYELESIRRTAESTTGYPITNMISVGGGTKNPLWLQVKADITNCRLSIPKIKEATLLGAALTAGIGCGIYKNEQEAVAAVKLTSQQEIQPNDTFHQEYKLLYEEGYMAFQEALRNYSLRFRM
ncbi:FGGY family carbohydrate kinase [Bacillus sp. JJ1533]|uniref:FGGY-family carbohydrate kinase n=1 Tax=Bacillus sp. JJ1533 TaxID=3122959 RepID=UPI002FFE11D5